MCRIKNISQTFSLSDFKVFGEKGFFTKSDDFASGMFFFFFKCANYLFPA